MTADSAASVIEVEPLRARDTAEQAVLELVTSIRRSDLDTGDRLPTLPELSDSLGIARDNVRRAMVILADAGVVITKPGRYGGTVMKDRAGIPRALATVLSRSISVDDDWEELISVRRLLQPEASRLIARRGEPEALARLSRHLEEMESYLQAGDVERALHAATELNCAIAVLCGNRVLADMLLRTIDRISVIGLLAMVRFQASREQLDQIAQTQRRLVSAIREGDESGIEAAIDDQMSLSLREARATSTHRRH